MISIIAAIGKNNELGKENKLLWSLPRDMKHFREKTKGHPVIMGRKTFESIGRPLPNRRNIIITRDLNYLRDSVDVVHSLEEALELLRTSPPSPLLDKERGARSESDERGEVEIFIIGGAEIYKQTIARADKLYITHLHAEFPEADSYFPFIDLDLWQKTKSEKFKKDEQNNFDLEFAEYLKK